MTTKYVQSKRAILQGSINDSTTTCALTGFLDLSGNPIVQADIGETGFGTFEPNTDREEAVSFTIDTNTEGVAVLTLTRGLLGKAPYGAGGTAFAHNSGTEFVMSNNPSLLNKMTAKDNNEVVTGSWEFPAPTADQSPATKLFVEELVNGGTVSVNRTVVAATAGVTVAAGDLVYFDDTDNEWKKTAGATAATLDGVLLGIAQGAGVNGGAIAGGVLTYGLDSTQTGMTVGVKLYASDTAGEISETAGTIEKVIGWSRSATQLYFDPTVDTIPTADEKDALAGASGTPGTDNKFLTEDIVDNLPALFVTGVSKKITTNPSTADLSGVTTEQNILTATLPANSLGTSNAVKLKAFISDWSQESSSCTIRLKYGSTTISSIVLNSSSDRNGLAGTVEALLVSDGATDAQMGSIFVDLSGASLNASGGDPTGDYLRQVTSGSATEDSTGSLTLSLTVQWAASNADNNLVLAGGVIELIS